MKKGAKILSGKNDFTAFRSSSCSAKSPIRTLKQIIIKKSSNGLINISFPKNQSNIVMAKLDRDGIAISNGPACGSGDVKPSPVLSEIGLDNQTNLSSLRFSFGSTNTAEEVDYLLSKLELNLIK